MKNLPLVLLVLLPLASVTAGPRGGSFSGSREGARGGSVDVQGERYGRYRSGSVEAEGPRGGTYDASGTQVGRFGTGSVNAEGPNGGSYDASATRAGRFTTGSVDAEGPNGGTVSRTATTWSGYRSGYVYTGGVYRPANVVVNTAYVAPLGVYAGWSVIARPYYITYPVYATYPVEVSVQVELERRGYYDGPIDGKIGPQTQKAIAKYQSQNGLPANGQINEALLKSLNIV